MVLRYPCYWCHPPKLTKTMGTIDKVSYRKRQKKVCYVLLDVKCFRCNQVTHFVVTHEEYRRIRNEKG